MSRPRSSQTVTVDLPGPLQVRTCVLAHKIDKQGQSLSVMPSRDIHIDQVHRWITQQISFEGLALDGDPADGTDRAEELARTSYPLAPDSLRRPPAEQFHARLWPNNATRLSGMEWLWSAKRA